MRARSPDLIPWRERVFIAVAEAAIIVARSPDWIRAYVGEGRLEGARLSQGGPLVIRVPSLLQLVDQAADVDPSEVKPLPHRPRRRVLRLVVNNA